MIKINNIEIIPFYIRIQKGFYEISILKIIKDREWNLFNFTYIEGSIFLFLFNEEFVLRYSK